MMQPMQGAHAQVKKPEKIFYDHGWNAYIAGERFDSFGNRDFRDGWRDCQYATKKYGLQKNI